MAPTLPRPDRGGFGKPKLRAALVLVLVLAVFLAAGLALRRGRLLDRHFIYFPESSLVETPADAGLEYEDVVFSAADGVELHGWFVPGEGQGTLLWLHGNAGNISHRVGNLALMRRHLGMSIFIFDYRGYGRSEGTPSEAGIYRDAEAALVYLRSQRGVDPERDVVLFGRSIGAAVAVETAARRRVRAVILESPLTSIRDVAHRAYPYLPSGVLVRLFEARYDALSRIREVHAPLMVLHGDRDGTIPMEAGRALFEAANEPKRFYTIEGADHNDTYLVGGRPYFEALRRFVNEVPPGPAG